MNTALMLSTSLQHRNVRDERRETEAELKLLTAREYEVARLVAKGFTNKEVGQILDISHWTVAAHLKATFIKLDMRRRAELVYALRGTI
jgi:DNA-binding CsgD family transcriptional regulator